MSTLKVNRIEAYSGSSVEVVGLAATASNALWSGISGIPAGLVSGSYSSSMSTRITAQENFSSSIDLTFATDADLTNLSSSASTARDQIATDYIAADTSLSGSASTARNQLATDYQTADTTLSSSLATDISTNADSISTLNGKTLVSSSIAGDAQGQIKVNGVNVNVLSLQTTSNPTFANLTGSNLLVSSNLTVQGTASFQYLQSITGSAKIIGDAYIILNNNTPTERYAGIAVYDSGSAGVTSSLEFDGQNNDWFYEYSDDGGVTTDHGVVIFGPEYSTKGSPTYLTSNTVPKSTGSHHIVDSNISDDGSTITLGSNTSITGTVVATGTTLVSGSAQINLASATGIAATASFATTASFALNAAGGLTAQTASTSLTMSANIAYVVTGTAAPITMSLPASPTVGDLIKFANMDDRATLLGRNSNNIMGLAQDMTLDIEQVSFDLVYVGPTAGWTIYGSRALS